jgi:hypothetical protein
MSLQPFVGPRPLFQFLNFSTQWLRPLGRRMSPSQGRYLHIHPCLNWDLNPRSQCLSGRRLFMPQIARPLWSAKKLKIILKIHWKFSVSVYLLLYVITILALGIVCLEYICIVLCVFSSYVDAAGNVICSNGKLSSNSIWSLAVSMLRLMHIECIWGILSRGYFLPHIFCL